MLVWLLQIMLIDSLHSRSQTTFCRVKGATVFVRNSVLTSFTCHGSFKAWPENTSWNTLFRNIEWSCLHLKTVLKPQLMYNTSISWVFLRVVFIRQKGIIVKNRFLSATVIQNWSFTLCPRKSNSPHSLKSNNNNKIYIWGIFPVAFLIADVGIAT